MLYGIVGDSECQFVIGIELVHTNTDSYFKVTALHVCLWYYFRLRV